MGLCFSARAGIAQAARTCGLKSQECLRDCSAGLQAGFLGFRLGSGRDTTGRATAGAGEGWIVFDKVTITYRGAKYEIGRGRDFYGIWITGGPRSQPLEWWPETPEGWSAAWTRFASIEAPGAIIPVGGLIANAVAAALSSVGAEPNELPLSPPRVWRLANPS